LSSGEDLIIDCEVRGPIDVSECKLTVGRNANITGSLRAFEIEVFGTVAGDVKALNRFTLHASGHLTGDVAASRITIEDGAYFSGTIDILRPPRRNEPSSSTHSVPIAEARYSELVDQKYVRGLTPSEQGEMDALAARLAELDAGFYEPLLQKVGADSVDDHVHHRAFQQR